MSYCFNRVPIPQPSSFSFNTTRTLLPSAYKSVHFCHVRNELTELVRVFGIGVVYNQSLFYNVVEFRLTQVGIHNRMTNLPFLWCSKRSKGDPVMIFKRMTSYCVIHWGSCFGDYLRPGWLAEYIVVKLENVVC